MRVDKWDLTFWFFEGSGGVVVERHGIPVDAALVREPWVEMTFQELSDWADEWLHRDGLTTQRAAQIRARNNRSKS